MKKWIYLFLWAICCLSPVHKSVAQELVNVSFVQSLSVSDLPLELRLFAENGIDLYKVLYTTSDVQGLPDTASGLLIIPQLEDVGVPLVVVQHGTVDGPEDVPSNLRGGWELGGVLGARGFAVIMPDMLGLGESRGFHPYVHAATESSAAIDMLYATREIDEQDDAFTLNEQLFVTGYSQGGHAAQALHRDLQNQFDDEFPVTAATHMSGPYSMSEVMYELILSDEPYGTVSYVPYTIMSYNEVYGLYDDLEEYLKQPYADMSMAFYRAEIGLAELNQQLIDTLVDREGAAVARFMLQDSLVEAMRNDPNHPTRVALRDNDTYDWKPEAPTRLYYCEGDDQVPFRNSVVADSVMRANGATSPDFNSAELSETADHVQCITPAVTSTIFYFANFQEITTGTYSQYPDPVRVWPNPARSQLYIQGLPADGQLQIMDLQGRSLRTWTTEADQMRLSLPSLNSGIYLLQLRSNAGYWSQKIVIQPE